MDSTRSVQFRRLEPCVILETIPLSQWRGITRQQLDFYPHVVNKWRAHNIDELKVAYWLTDYSRNRDPARTPNATFAFRAPQWGGTTIRGSPHVDGVLCYGGLDGNNNCLGGAMPCELKFQLVHGGQGNSVHSSQAQWNALHREGGVYCVANMRRRYIPARQGKPAAETGYVDLVLIGPNASSGN